MHLASPLHSYLKADFVDLIFLGFNLFILPNVPSVTKRQKKISENILNYLKKNPNAEDTLEGITMWWLEFERIDQSVEEVAKTLDGMVKHGEIEKLCHKANNMITFRARHSSD